MNELITKLPIRTEEGTSQRTLSTQLSRPFMHLRREIDRLFSDFDRGAFMAPFRSSVFDAEPPWSRETSLSTCPAMDVAEHEKSYEITAELPGMDEKNIELKLVNGALAIKGEKLDEKEESQKGYHLQERSFGSFERRFQLPEGVDTNKIEATFRKGVLTVTVPKSVEALKAEKKITVKAA